MEFRLTGPLEGIYEHDAERTTPTDPGTAVHPSRVPGGRFRARHRRTSVTPARAASGDVIAYVGAATNAARNTGGIYSYHVNQSDGSLTLKSALTNIASPNYLVIHPNKKYMYAVNSIANFAGTTNGSVTALSIDEGTGDLKVMNVVNAQGGGTTHVSVDPTGKWVFVANYGGSNAAVLPIMADGSLGSATDVAEINGPLGPRNAEDGPLGNYNDSGHDATHPHMAQTDPDGNFLFVSDLGTDRVYIYKFDKVNGKLTPNDQPFLQASPGAGPRHFVFHPNRRWAYVVNEESATMLFAAYDAAKGTLEIKQSASTLPEKFVGTNYPAAIKLSADGRFLYVIQPQFQFALHLRDQFRRLDDPSWRRMDAGTLSLRHRAGSLRKFHVCDEYQQRLLSLHSASTRLREDSPSPGSLFRCRFPG